MMSRVQILALLLMILVGVAVAECPFQVACPYDGEAMHNTWNCKFAPHACEYAHTYYKDGKQIKHTTWVTCGD